MFNLAGLAILFTAAVSVTAVPSHFARHPHNHREIAARVPQPEVAPVPEVVARDMSVTGRRMLRRRGNGGRCNPPASSSPIPSPTPSEEPQSSSDPVPTVSTPDVKGGLNNPATTPSEDPQQPSPTPNNDTPTPTPTPSPAPATTSDSPTPTPTPTPDNSSNNSGSSGGGQTYTGQGM